MREPIFAPRQIRCGRIRRWLVIPVLFLACLTVARTQVDDRKQARPDSALEEIAPLSLDQVSSGELLWKSERGLIPLPIAGLEVELRVSGMVTRGKLTQRFHNPTGEIIEALYAFPLPERAAIHSMEMTVGQRRIVSEIREKEEARRTYQRARDEGRKAALLHQKRPNLFTTSLANIEPGETVSVTLEYLEETHYDDGRFSLRFPLAYTPRFMPPPAPGRPLFPGDELDPADAGDLLGARGARRVRVEGASYPRASVSVRLTSGLALEQLTSSSHAVRIHEEGAVHVVETEPGRVPADRDFLLAWRPRLEDLPQTAVFTEEAGGETYALVLIVPPRPRSEAGLGLPTETLFIIDVSGSMAGPSIRQARQALLAALERLRPEDRFNILKFNDSRQAFRDEFQQAEQEQLEQAKAWVRGLDAGGGTMIYPALMQGLEMMGRSRGSHAQRIVFLTDGAVGNEQEVLRSITERLGTIRLHTIGIGHAPNGYLMRKMAALGRGLCEFVASTSDAENRVEEFFARLDRPVMADLELRGEGLELGETYPSRITDLYSGQPLLLSMRLGRWQGDGTLSLGGYTRDGWIESTARVSDRAPRGEGIAVRWARTKVGSLLDSLHEGADPADVRAEVVDLGLAFHLVTPYTSLVAVDDRVSAPGGPHAVRTAHALPSGGTDRRLRLLLGWALVCLGLLALLLVKSGTPQ